MDARPLGVLVGVDGSEPSLAAADWAAAEAADRGIRLTVCAVAEVAAVPDVPLPAGLRAGASRYGQKAVDRAIVRAHAVAPGLLADGVVVTGRPAADLIRLGAGAELVVLGSRGVGGFEQLLLGSVGAQVAAHTPCPVVVVRGPAGRAGSGDPVVVGVDGSAHGERALDHAFDFAARNGLGLHAVHAFSGLVAAPPVPAPMLVTAGDLAQAAEGVIREVLDPWTEKYPDVPVERTVTEGSAAQVLAEESRAASLVVVGSRGHGGFAGLLLGSVSQALLRHGHCPIAVAR